MGAYLPKGRGQRLAPPKGQLAQKVGKCVGLQREAWRRTETFVRAVAAREAPSQAPLQAQFTQPPPQTVALSYSCCLFARA